MHLKSDPVPLLGLSLSMVGVRHFSLFNINAARVKLIIHGKMLKIKNYNKQTRVTITIYKILDYAEKAYGTIKLTKVSIFN